MQKKKDDINCEIDLAIRAALHETGLKLKTIKTEMDSYVTFLKEQLEKVCNYFDTQLILCVGNKTTFTAQISE